MFHWWILRQWCYDTKMAHSVLLGQLLHFHTKIHTYTIDKFINGWHDDDSLFGFSGGSDSIKFAFNAGDLGLIPGMGKSPGEGNGNPCQYSCLENSMGRGAGRLQSMGSQTVVHEWVTNTFKNQSLGLTAHDLGALIIHGCAFGSQ